MPGADRLCLRIDSKAYAGIPVLGRVYAGAGQGEILALLAPSGTGKSTTLRIALGLDTDFAGSVERPAGRAAAMFQEPRLLPWLTVAENLRLVAPELPPARLAALLELVGLPDVSALRPKALSLGMARRVALARALAVEPRFLALDEPFASLDASLAARLAAATAREARQLGAVVLLATHDLGQALTIADRVLVLEGRPAGLALDQKVAGAGVGFAAELRARFPFLEGAGAGPPRGDELVPGLWALPLGRRRTGEG